MGPGATVGVLGTGVPRLACLRRGSKGGPTRPISTNTNPRPSRRAKPRGADDVELSSGAASSGWLTRRRRDQGGVPHEVPVTQAMTTRGARQVRARTPFLFGAKEASAAAEYRGTRQGLPFRCNETKTGRTTSRRSPWSPRRRHHQSFAQVKTTFVRIVHTSCPLQISPPLLAPFPLNVWEEDQGLYK